MIVASPRSPILKLGANAWHSTGGSGSGNGDVRRTGDAAGGGGGGLGFDLGVGLAAVPAATKLLGEVKGAAMEAYHRWQVRFGQTR